MSTLFIRITLVLLLALAFGWPDSRAFAASAVVGSGTPSSCDESAFNTALSTVLGDASGVITFNCGGPATITFTSVKTIRGPGLTPPARAVTIDGGGQITLSGADTTALFGIESDAPPAPQTVLTLRNITLANGNGLYDGGAIHNQSGLLRIERSILRNNTSVSSGGAVASTLGGSVSISDSILISNTAFIYGGAIAIGGGGSLNMTNTVLENNHATFISAGNGGAVYLDGTPATISGGRFTRNGGTYGGALHSSGLITVTSVLFDNNRAFSGGAMQTTQTAAISATRFISNSAAAFDNLGTGGAIINSGLLQIENSHFLSNTAQTRGGALTTSSLLIVADSTFMNNAVAADGAGGAIAINNDGSAIIGRVAFEMNHAGSPRDISHMGAGGAIFNAGRAVIVDALFKGNTASGPGGAIYITTSGIGVISGSIIREGAAMFGAGISNDGKLDMFTSSVTANQAKFRGGGIESASQLDLSASTISDNRAELGGGGLLISARATLTNVTISANHVLSSSSVFGGGGVLVGERSVMSLTQVTFSANSANSGGNLFAEPFARVTLKNVVLAKAAGTVNCNLPGISSRIISLGNNIADDASCPSSPSDKVVTATLLGLLQDNGGRTQTQLPALGSPLIDAGACIPEVVFDQRDKPRPIDAACDVGAVERQPSDDLPPTPTPRPSATLNPSDARPVAYLPLIQR